MCLILLLLTFCSHTLARPRGVQAEVPKALKTPAALPRHQRPLAPPKPYAVPRRSKLPPYALKVQQNANLEVDRGGEEAEDRLPILGVLLAAAATLFSIFIWLVLPTIRPLVAGSIAGAIGVGVAYPFDSIKTKSQALAARGEASRGLFGMFCYVLEDEGISGFYQGVTGAMLGQAVVKAVAFASNDWALTELSGGVSPTVWQLIASAMFAGLFTSFFVNPVERIKVVMQAGSVGNSNELQALRQLKESDGLQGLMFRGLSATLAREIPSYGLYFVVYGLLLVQWQSIVISEPMASLGPLFCGGLAGMASWLPVYPIDVVKTEMQNTLSGMESERPSMTRTAMRLYETQGLGVFWEGLDSKLLRACVNHAVAFYVFDLLMSL
jgi:solute carrier family 25 carnitine/acylcarnitine transporter 20/29